MTTWEYKWITPNPCTADATASVHFERNIAEAGAEGWEIVAFDGPLRAFAKRTRPADDPAPAERKPSSLAGYVTDESGAAPCHTCKCGKRPRLKHAVERHGDSLTLVECVDCRSCTAWFGHSLAAVRTWNQMVAAEHGLPPCPACGAPAVRQHQDKHVFERRVACSAEACKTFTAWACNSAQADLYWREMCPPEGSRPISRTVRPPIDFEDDEAPVPTPAQHTHTWQWYPGKVAKICACGETVPKIAEHTDIAAQAHGKGQESAIADVAEWLDLLWAFDEDRSSSSYSSYTDLSRRLRSGTWLKDLERLRQKEKKT